MTNARLRESEGLACGSENLALGVWEVRKHFPPGFFRFGGQSFRSALICRTAVPRLQPPNAPINARISSSKSDASVSVCAISSRSNSR
jgi:hypothetical protein